MPKFNKKTNAFTIAEMLVVLVISAITISLAMLVLQLVQTQLTTISANYNQQTETSILENVLSKDFNKHRLFYNSNQQQLQCVSEIDTVTYTFRENYTLRNTDTLQVPIYKTIAYIEGIPIKTISQIDALELQLKKEQPQNILFISTTKDGAYYINGL